MTDLEQELSSALEQASKQITFLVCSIEIFLEKRDGAPVAHDPSILSSLRRYSELLAKARRNG